MLSRQHYEAIAEIIKDERNTYGYLQPCKRFADRLADYFAQDNLRFDRKRFMATCGLLDTN